MKRLVLSAMMLILVSAYPALAVEEHHPDQKPGTGAAQAAPAKPAADPEKVVQKLKDNTKKLQAQLDKIAKTKDPKERQKLLAEHMQTMRESMMTAKGMQAGMMDCPMMSGMMGGMMGDMIKRHEMMEKRMDMMQMMMEQLMKSQGQPAPAK